MRKKQQLSVEQYGIKSKQVRKSIKMVLLADLHNKEYGIQNEYLIKLVRKQHPDVIVIAGDLMISKGCNSMKELQVAMTLLESLVTIAPVYYGNGNHERTVKEGEDSHIIYQQYRKWLLDRKVHHLVNQKMILEEYGIQITGLDLPRRYFKRLWHAPLSVVTMNRLVGDTSKRYFQILIAHNPDYFKVYGKWGANLTLSGHLHGGIVRLPYLGGVISPSLRLFPKYDGGEFKEGNHNMIVSRGVGMHTIPLRINNPPEVVMIYLEKE